jgi:hypothetical protein
MRNPVGLLLAFSLSLPGCFVEHHTYDANPPNGTPVVTGSATYHVLAGGSAVIPSGDLGYTVTANGQGGYRLAYTDTLGTSAEFSGTVWTDGEFDARQLSSLSGANSFTLSAPNRIDFDSFPGASLDGFDLVSSTDPIYLDARVSGAQAGFDILFPDAATGGTATSAYNPVAFTSP